MTERYLCWLPLCLLCQSKTTTLPFPPEHAFTVGQLYLIVLRICATPACFGDQEVQQAPHKQIAVELLKLILHISPLV